MTNDCPFCKIIHDATSNRVLFRNPFATAFTDGFPITEGHALIIPNRHVDSFFKITKKEQLSLFSLLDLVKAHIDARYFPISYNIGINDGPEAGQTIDHLHIHLIPRYKGDVSDPRGGVRWIIPEKADYWSSRA